MSITKNDRKKLFRKECLSELKKEQKRGSYRKDKDILGILYQLVERYNAKSIMLYIPLSIEVNIYPLINRLRKEQKTIFVPFMEGDSFRLVKYRLPLKKKQFGIKEPNNSKQYRRRDLDLAIVPIVGIDVSEKRIGFGKGMYDRFFEKENENIKKTIFVSRKLCRSLDILTDNYDIKADIIVTYKRVYQG
ncbi:MAG: 5-formyltetrahydrofolate cyclo-ligase [Sulfurovum sp.]